MIVDDAAGGIPIFVAANFVQQLCASDDAVGILNEELKSLELTGSQRY